VKARITQHFRDLQDGSHANPLLQRDYAQQQGHQFRPIVLRLVANPAELADAEMRAIRAALRQRQKLYNLTEDGQGSPSGRMAGAIDADGTEAISERANRPRERRGSPEAFPRTTISQGIESAAPDDPVQRDNPGLSDNVRSALSFLFWAAVAALIFLWLRRH
jgi:hypothetical protein